MTTQTKTTLLVIRHGETVWNMEERFQGHGDSPLTEKGRSQARALGSRLRNAVFDNFFCSDLGRAQETAELIAGYTGHPIQTDYRLRERNYGVLEGLTVPEIKRRHSSVFEQLKTDDPDYVIPSGESHRQLYQRNIDFFEALLAEKPGTTSALVVHGGVLDSIFRYVARLPLDRPRCFITTNAGLSVVSQGIFYGTPRWVIETWGDVGHLQEIGYHPGLG